MFYWLAFCSLSCGVASYVRSKFFDNKQRDQWEVFAFSLVILGIIFLLGTMGLSNGAVVGSSITLCIICFVFEIFT